MTDYSLPVVRIPLKFTETELDQFIKNILGDVCDNISFTIKETYSIKTVRQRIEISKEQFDRVEKILKEIEHIQKGN